MFKAFEVANVVMSIILIGLFIGLFFFTYGLYLEKKVITTQLNYMIDDTFDAIKIFMPSLSNDIKNSIANYNISIDKSTDKIVDDHNNTILKRAMTYILFGLIIGVIIITIIMKKLDMEGMTNKEFILKLLKYNIITLIFIALTEYSFATFFGQNYMSINTNKIKNSVINTMKIIRDSPTDIDLVKNVLKSDAASGVDVGVNIANLITQNKINTLNISQESKDFINTNINQLSNTTSTTAKNTIYNL